MKIHHALDAKRADARPLVMAIGFFDGVHRGHREILRTLARLRRPGFRSAALTFVNHPASFLRPGDEPPLITTLEERVNLLAEAGIDELYLLPFDERIARMECETFLAALPAELRALVVGENFRFGARRSGDVECARRLLQARGVPVTAIAPLEDDGERISSTRIREAIVQGEFEIADKLLGRSYMVRGRVVLGEGRGHDLGFPTANLLVPPEKTIPRDGVYTVIGRHAGRDYRGLVSIGDKPTFSGTEKAVEVWLLDFQETIYGEELSLRELRFVREQERFSSVDALLERMRADAALVAFSP